MKQRFRWLFVMLSVCMIITMLPVQSLASQQTFTDKYGTWAYEEEADGSITIVSFQSTRKNIVVPNSINGKPVRNLGDGLFRDRNDLTMIVIPYGITTIGNDVFSGCAKLEKVTLPQSLKAIGDSAFSNCANLLDVFLPSSVTEFGKNLFVCSPKVNVRCENHSPAAEYLKENAKDIHSFTLIDVTPPQSTTPPVSNGSDVTPTVQGKLVCYQFGRNINGQREFTVILIDTMPDMDLMQYLKVTAGPDGNTRTELDSKVLELMNQRFHLVSLTQWDGKTSTDIPLKSKNLSAYHSFDHVQDGGQWITIVNYVLVLPLDSEQLANGSLSCMLFSADNKLLSYDLDKYYEKDSVVKENPQTYYIYSFNQERYETYYADGELIHGYNYKYAEANKHAIGGTSVQGSVRSGISADKQDLTKKVTSVSLGHIIAAAELDNTIYNVPSENGITRRKSVCIDSFSSNRHLSEFRKSINFQENDNIASSHYNSSTLKDDGTRHTFSGSYTNTHQWESSDIFQDDHCSTKYESHHTGCDEVFYSNTVVRADSMYENSAPVFPNEPDERKNYVSTKHYEATGNLHTEITSTNLTTGQVKSSVQDTQSLAMEHHIFIRDTGKFVGWDWNWNNNSFASANDPSSKYDSSDYSVTEYQYDSTTDTWTKTEVHVNARGANTANPEDFREQYFSGKLESCYTNIWKWKFDSTTASGSDNWLMLSFDDTANPDAAAILKGDSTVTDEDGNNIKQSDAEKEMLEIGKDVEATLKKDDLEQIFEDAVDKIPDGADVLDQAQDIFDTQTPPESNTDDQIECVPAPDGSFEIIVTPDESVSQAEETMPQEPATEVPEAKIEVAEKSATEEPQAEETVVNETAIEVPNAEKAEAEVIETETN